MLKPNCFIIKHLMLKIMEEFLEKVNLKSHERDY